MWGKKTPSKQTKPHSPKKPWKETDLNYQNHYTSIKEKTCQKKPWGFALECWQPFVLLWVPWARLWGNQNGHRSWWTLRTLAVLASNKQCQGHGGVLGDPTNKSCSENTSKEFYWYLGAAAWLARWKFVRFFCWGGKWQKKGQGKSWVEVVTWLHSIQWLCCGILEWTTGPSIILLHFLGIYGSSCHLHF